MPESKPPKMKFEEVRGCPGLTIYKDTRTTKGNYVARIRLGDGLIKSRTTKTNNRSKAELKAIQIYDDLQSRVRQNIPLADPTLKECLENWSNWSSRKLTKRRVLAVKTLFTRIFEPWVNEIIESDKGLEFKVTNIRKKHLDQFPEWREIYQKKSGKKQMARSSLENEIGSFNAVLKYCHEQKFTDKLYQIPRLSKAVYHKEVATKRKARPSYNTFTEDQINALDSYFKRHIINPKSHWNNKIIGWDSKDVKTRNPRINSDGSTSSKGSQGSAYLSRINLYCTYFILKNVGMRLSELMDCRWSDIEEVQLKDKRMASKHNPNGSVFIFKLKETKKMRIASTGKTYRLAVGPYWLKAACFDKIKRENAKHCSPDDYVINQQGRRKRTQQVLFEKVQAGPKTITINGIKKQIDCSTHADGTSLDLRHLRSYYVSKMLLERGVSPIVLCNQTGHAIETILKYYLTRTPSQQSMAIFGGHNASIPQQLVDNVMALKAPRND